MTVHSINDTREPANTAAAKAGKTLAQLASDGDRLAIAKQKQQDQGRAPAPPKRQDDARTGGVDRKA